MYYDKHPFGTAGIDLVVVKYHTFGTAGLDLVVVEHGTHCIECFDIAILNHVSSFNVRKGVVLPEQFQNVEG